MEDSEGKRKKLVYLFGISLWNENQVQNLIRIVEFQVEEQPIIDIVLIHDGVIGTSTKGITPASLTKLFNLPITIYVMSPDVKARGINPNDLHKQIKIIEYEDLVDILAEKVSIISWL
jgi:sulfur relay protein TusB/DsrH